MDFEINHIFLIEPFFLLDQKVIRKLKYLENEAFFIILKKIVPDLGVNL